MVSTCPLISTSSSPSTCPLVTVPRSPITIGITVTLMFHIFSIPKQAGTYPSFHFLSILLCSQPGQQSPQFDKFYLFLLLIIRPGRLAEIRWSVCIPKSLRRLCVSFSRTDTSLCVYHLFAWSNFNFFSNSEWITLPTRSYLVLYSFCANLQHSLIMWLMVSSRSPHLLYLSHLIYSCVDIIGPYGVVFCCY